MSLQVVPVLDDVVIIDEVAFGKNDLTHFSMKLFAGTGYAFVKRQLPYHIFRDGEGDTQVVSFT